ncbi:TlpA family protein disulfide reductase [Cryobacterium tepidiphilum]|nr:TlpA disulfide reductase family protein [Cryobacterium tepidiphilum]
MASGKRFRQVNAIAGILSVVMLFTACAPDPLAEQYRAGSGKNYIAGDGTVTEIAPGDRSATVEFSATVESGEDVRSLDFAGDVMVLNFWYAGCAPCRAEAPDLQALWEKYQAENVQFLGVNIRDQVGTAKAFSQSYGVTYPSVIDVNTGAVQLAFSGSVAPNAVPTTLVLDRQGRIASRILGRIPAPSVLDSLIRTALEEQPQQ